MSVSGFDTVACESLVKSEALRRLDGVAVDREALKEIKVEAERSWSGS